MSSDRATTDHSQFRRSGKAAKGLPIIAKHRPRLPDGIAARLAIMDVTIQFSEREELRALPTLLRHISGRILTGRRYVVDASVPDWLRKLGVRFEVIRPETLSKDSSDSSNET